MKISKRASQLTYAIRDVQIKADELKRAGYEIISLNIGDPNKFDFDVPDNLKNELIKVAKSKSGYYSNSLGENSVRTKIAEYENTKYNVNVSDSEIIVTNGVSEAIFYLFLSFANPGEEILIPEPSYPAYISAGSVAQVKTIGYRTNENNGWLPDIDDLRTKINMKTKAIVVINPNNPTGAVYPEKILKEIVQIAGEHNLTIISDEIYDRQILDATAKFTSLGQLAKGVPTVIFNGFSKNYLAPGWRIGYTYRVDSENKIAEPFEGIRKLCRMRLSPSTPLSLAAASALELNPPHLPEMLQKLKDRRNYVVKRFNEIDNISTTTPQAAFYIFPKLDLSQIKQNTDKEFVMGLLEQEKVLLVHGSGFGAKYGKDHFRMVYLPPENILEKGLDKIIKFMNQK